jgi:mannosyltransferase OCH1-like enzyme
MIPKIIHQIWIGPKPAPTKLMDTWKDKHPDFEYIRWSEAEMKKRDLPLSCVNRIDDMEEINGKADIIRWEILYHYGGYFFDADCFCIEPLNEYITNLKAFAIWENEQCRKDLVAPGAMGFPPKHPMVRACIEWIHQNDVSVRRTKLRAWQSVGPGLITKMHHTKKFPDVTILPSYHFLPVHHTRLEYRGHAKVYAHQEWGSSFQSYDKMNEVMVGSTFFPPSKDDMYKNVSILVSSYNTKIEYIHACLESIKHQNGHFNMELVWINDGSGSLESDLLKRALEHFENTTRFTTVVYSENESNKGIGYSLNKGVKMCSHEIIVKMDSDDIMLQSRIEKQLDYMKTHPEVKMCGAQVHMFHDNGNVVNKTSHPSLTWDQYKAKPNHWFINHPTVCYRKSAILEAGNYDPNLNKMAEDFELELRMLKTHGYAHNMDEVLLNYRLHEKQITHKGGSEGTNYWNEKRNEIVKNIIVNL